MKKIIQITTTVFQNIFYTTALTEDGKIWTSAGESEWREKSLDVYVPEVKPIDLVKPKEYNTVNLKKAFIYGVKEADNPYARNPYKAEQDEYQVWLEGRVYGLGV